MDKTEARALLAHELESWRSRSWTELAALIDGEPATKSLAGARGTEYLVEIEVVWDAKPKGDVRVLASIDDGGLRAFVPLTDGFILSPDGSFVGEDRV